MRLNTCAQSETYRREQRPAGADRGNTRPRKVSTQNKPIYSSCEVSNQKGDSPHFPLDLGGGSDLRYHIEQEMDDADMEEDWGDESPPFCY